MGKDSTETDDRPPMPEWVCKTKAQRDAFEGWTNRKLEEVKGWPVGRPQFSTLLSVDGKPRHFEAVLFTNEQARARLLKEVREQSGEAGLERFRSNPKMVAALASLNKRGPKGKRHPLIATIQLSRAKAQKQLIKEIWKREFGRSNRGPNNRPTAAEIVWKRFKAAGVTLNKEDIGAAD